MSSGTTIEPTDVLLQIIQLAAQGLSGPVVGKINTYDPVSDRASVTASVPLLLNGEAQDVFTKVSVPVEWYRSATHSVRFPLAAGAIVALEPKGHDHGAWFASGADGVPAASDHRFSIADLVARPLAPSPVADPPDPLSYDAAWGVLFGQWAIGDSSATKAVALHQDVCPAIALMRTWMAQVETAINGLAPGAVAPLSTTFAGTAIAQVTATALKAKAK